MAAGILLVCSGCSSEATSRGSFEVHEWGVLAGCLDSKQYVLTSRPLRVMKIREPVVYVHAIDETPFSLEVVFHRGQPTDTYPPAEISADRIRWQSVQPVESPRMPSRALSHTDFVPLENILPTLNDVDADRLVYREHVSRFLFYEGDVPFRSPIVVEHDLDDKSVTVQNDGARPVHDLLVIVPEQTGARFSSRVHTAHLARLEPGRSAILALEPLDEQFSFAPMLTRLGFTEPEARSFDKLWREPFLRPTHRAGWRHVVYRLSDEVCREISELRFSPAPRKLVRALFVFERHFPGREQATTGDKPTE